MESVKSLVKQFLEEGWIITLIGAAGMLARLLIDPKNTGYVDQLKKIASAAILSGIAWFILEQVEVASFYKAITYGIIGVISPEILNGIVKLAKRFQNSPEKVLERFIKK